MIPANTFLCLFKEGKCLNMLFIFKVWLCLLNQYKLANIFTIKKGFQNISGRKSHFGYGLLSFHEHTQL